MQQSLMPRRAHLRSRVLWMTAAFALVLFATTFGLSWRARVAQDRWSRVIRVDMEATGALESLIHAQNAFRSRLMQLRAVSADDGAGMTRDRYREVEQLLHTSSLDRLDATALRGRVKAFAEVAGDPKSRNQDISVTSTLLVEEAQRMIDERRLEMSRTIPELERDSEGMMRSGLAVAWILVMISFAAVQVTLRKVVQPLEDLAAAADRIAAGDLTAHARVAGDQEIARVATALNGMADELRARARTDELTGLPNFRAFRERIETEISRAARYPTTFGVLVLDLDRFKKYNDTFGHLAGNDALTRVSHVIAQTVRSVDFAARYGGEEFAVVLPEVDVAALGVIAERIRANVQALPAPADGSAVTISGGAALFPMDGADAETLFHAADERLYAAKHAGRNRVVVPAEGVERVGSGA